MSKYDGEVSQDRFFRNQAQIEESIELVTPKVLADVDDDSTLQGFGAGDLEGTVLAVLSAVSDFIEGDASSVIPEIRKILDTASDIVAAEGDQQGVGE